MSKPVVDTAKGMDAVLIQRLREVKITDLMFWKSTWRIDRFEDPMGEVEKFLREGGLIEEAVLRFGGYLDFSEFEGNCLLNEGIQAFEDLLAGLATPTKWDNANARVGVGDSNVAETPTQTGLQAATNKTWKPMDSGYPSRSAQELSWRGTFGGTDANYAWNEFTVVNAADDTGANLNRKVSAQGTKTSGQTWVLTVKISIS